MIKILKMGRNTRTESYVLYLSAATSLTASKKEKRRHTRQTIANDYRIETLPESASLGVARNPSDLPLIALSKSAAAEPRRPGGRARGEDRGKESGNEREGIETRQEKANTRVHKEGLALCR